MVASACDSSFWLFSCCSSCSDINASLSAIDTSNCKTVSHQVKSQRLGRGKQINTYCHDPSLPLFSACVSLLVTHEPVGMAYICLAHGFSRYDEVWTTRCAPVPFVSTNLTDSCLWSMNSQPDRSGAAACICINCHKPIFPIADFLWSAY